MAGRHRSNAFWPGTAFRRHRAPSRDRRDYSGKHRDTLFGRLSGRPTVGQIRRSNAAPGVFPGLRDSWTRPRGSAKVNLFGGRFGSWT